MKVTVEDTREFPEYKNVQITALFRNLLCEFVNDRTYWTWNEIERELSPRFSDVIKDADYLCDDHGNTWARSFTPKGRK